MSLFCACFYSSTGWNHATKRLLLKYLRFHLLETKAARARNTPLLCTAGWNDWFALLPFRSCDSCSPVSEDCLNSECYRWNELVSITLTRVKRLGMAGVLYVDCRSFSSQFQFLQTFFWFLPKWYPLKPASAAEVFSSLLGLLTDACHGRPVHDLTIVRGPMNPTANLKTFPAIWTKRCLFGAYSRMWHAFVPTIALVFVFTSFFCTISACDLGPSDSSMFRMFGKALPVFQFVCIFSILSDCLQLFPLYSWSRVLWCLHRSSIILGIPTRGFSFERMLSLKLTGHLAPEKWWLEDFMAWEIPRWWVPDTTAAWQGRRQGCQLGR